VSAGIGPIYDASSPFPARGPDNVGLVPTVDGLSFSYVLHELPPGRLPFRRWRFELWHGARLEAAGWRTTERDAVRALRKHGSRVGHRMFGLRPPPDGEGPGKGGFVLMPGTAVRVQHGAVTFTLVPRNLDRPALLSPLAS
jgi:hypothetical protein